jgi:hypothetical protein
MLAWAARDCEHTSQVVMQGATLIVRIVGPMFVLATIVVGMMVVYVSDPTGLTEVGSNILLILEGMLDMDAGQRQDAHCLGEHKKPQEQRAKASQLSE